jgi:deoxyribose-phosphate aldolase
MSRLTQPDADRPTDRGYDYRRYAGSIDHSLLRPEPAIDDVRQGCRLAARDGVAPVCVRPADVALAAELLSGEPVQVGTVVGFPHGGTTTTISARGPGKRPHRNATAFEQEAQPAGRARIGDASDH